MSARTAVRCLMTRAFIEIRATTHIVEARCRDRAGDRQDGKGDERLPAESARPHGPRPPQPCNSYPVEPFFKVMKTMKGERTWNQTPVLPSSSPNAATR